MALAEGIADRPGVAVSCVLLALACSAPSRELPAGPPPSASLPAPERGPPLPGPDPSATLAARVRQGMSARNGDAGPPIAAARPGTLPASLPVARSVPQDEEASAGRRRVRIIVAGIVVLGAAAALGASLGRAARRRP